MRKVGFFFLPSPSLRLKAIIVLIVVHLALVSTFVFYTIGGYHRMVEDLMKENYRNFIATIGMLLADALHNGDLESLQWHLNQLELNPDIIYIAVYDIHGFLLKNKITADYGEQFAQASRARGDEIAGGIEFKEIGHPHGFFHRKGHNYDFLIPLLWEREFIGKVQIGINTATVNQRVAQESTRGIQIIIGSIAIGLIIIALIARRIKSLLTQLILTTRKMATGDLSQKVTIRTGDELEVLGNSFNIMAEAIQEREAIIERHKNHLEEMVKERTRNLAEEHDKLKAVLDNVPSAIILVDPELTIQMVSAQFESIVRRPAGEILGMKCSSEICSWCDSTSCLVKDALNDKEIKTTIVSTLSSSQYEQRLEHVAIPLIHENRLFGVLEIITDVTEKIEMQRHLIRTEKLSATGEISAIIAHEVRNSLTSVKMILQLLLEKAEDSDKQSIQVALHSISRMEKIVNDLLGFSRPAEIQKSPCDLHAIIKESVQITRHQFQNKPIKVQLDLRAQPSSMLLDGNQMKEVMVNLLINAIQAIPEFGNIAITTRTSILSKNYYDFASLPAYPGSFLTSSLIQKIELKAGDFALIVDITDTGEGIAPEHITRIFDPFFTTKINGTGLGLSLVKRTINAHGGIITVQSQPHFETKFTIYLPLMVPA